MKYTYPITNFVTAWDGGRVHVNVNQVWEADDPFVAAHREMFSDTPQDVRRTTAPTIETATAAPGEIRNTRRGVK